MNVPPNSPGITPSSPPIPGTIPCQPPMSPRRLAPDYLSLNFTKEDIIDLRVMQADRDKNNRLAARDRLERRLIQQGRCMSMNPDLKSPVNIRLFQITEQKIIDKLQDSYQNANFHDNLSCVVDAVIYATPNEGTISRITSFFRDTQVIGVPSAMGVAMSTHINAPSKFTLSGGGGGGVGSSIFVIKTSSGREDYLAHEVMVGFYATNLLRVMIPNFMFIYGFFNCASPMINNKIINTWCKSKQGNGSTYIITENIRNSTTLRDFVNICTYADFAKVFFEIINALIVAYQKFGYTHYDLHYENILVRKFAQLMAVPYYGTQYNIQGYIVSQFVPFIIDPGNTRVKIEGIAFGPYNVPGVDPTDEFPLQDIYKIICFTGYSLLVKGITTVDQQQIFDALSGVYQFFQEGNFMDRLTFYIQTWADPNVKVKDYFNADNHFKGGIPQDFLDFAVNVIPLDIETAPTAYLLSNETNLDFCEFMANISSGNLPQTLIEYNIAMEQINTITNPDERLKARQWLRPLDVMTMADEAIKFKLDTLADNINILTGSAPGGLGVGIGMGGVGGGMGGVGVGGGMGGVGVGGGMGVGGVGGVVGGGFIVPPVGGMGIVTSFAPNMFQPTNSFQAANIPTYRDQINMLGKMKNYVQEYIDTVNQIHLAFINSGKLRTSPVAGQKLNIIGGYAQKIMAYYESQINIVRDNLRILRTIVGDPGATGFIVDYEKYLNLLE